MTMAKDEQPTMSTAPNAGLPMNAIRGKRKAAQQAALDALASGEDMSAEQWRGLLSGLAEFFGEEAEEDEHAEDSEKNAAAETEKAAIAPWTEANASGERWVAQDAAIDHAKNAAAKLGWPVTATDGTMRLALDKDSVRELSKDGMMRVAKANISKATVNPYLGHEIPNWEGLGLDPEHVYQLLRAPGELKKAAASFNGVPLLRRHIPVSADDIDGKDIVGSIGTEAEFDEPFLTNSLIVWTKEGIDLIEGDQKELSCGYHYDADMTPGSYHGQRYDGIMTNIKGNHVALVKDGRAGADVVVGDSAVNIQWAALERELQVLGEA